MALLAAASPALAVVAGDETVNIPAGQAVMQGFNVNRGAEITVTTAANLTIAVANWSDCQAAQSQGTPVPSVIEGKTSTSGSLTVSVSGGQYCAIVGNLSNQTVQAEICVDAN